MNTAMISPTSFEAVWVRRTEAGNHDALGLTKTFGSRIFRIAKHITQNERPAEDVLVETFVEACSDLPQFQDDKDLWIELVTIAVRKAFSKLRDGDGGRPPFDELDPSEELVIREISSWGDDYQDRYSVEQTTGILEDAIGSLNPMCRAVFVLRDIEDIPVDDVARILDRSAAAVDVCLLRARLQLREVLTRKFRQ